MLPLPRLWFCLRLDAANNGLFPSAELEQILSVPSADCSAGIDVLFDEVGVEYYEFRPDLRPLTCQEAYLVPTSYVQNGSLSG